uniref:Uncharacterized protein n=1 Tax=viral metagenome TaxID=1070528 RepID=A0A6C0HXA4_9ZZZZ
MPIIVNIYSLQLSFVTYQQPTITIIIDHLNNKNIYIRKIIKELTKMYPQHKEIIKELFENNIIKIYNITKNTGGFVNKIDLVL